MNELLSGMIAIEGRAQAAALERRWAAPLEEALRPLRMTRPRDS